MVHVRDRAKGVRVVAIITSDRRRDMIGWFTGRGDLPASRVARITVRWCALKYTADMATFALNAFVGPREQKTRLKMIKIELPRFGGSGLRCQESASTEQYNAYKPDALGLQSHRIFVVKLQFHLFFSSLGFESFMR